MDARSRGQRLRYALSRSINTVSLELAYNLQPKTVVEFARKMGIASELKPDLSIALGSHEVTPLEHTNAVATLATGGIAAPAQFIDAIDGKRLPAPAGEQVLRPEVAYVVTDILGGSCSRSTGSRRKWRKRR